MRNFYNRLMLKFISNTRVLCRPGSSVGIATGYLLHGPGIESWWGRDFPHLSRPTLGPTQPPVQWVPGLSRGVKSGRGVTLTPHPLLVRWSRKGRAKPLLPLWAVRTVQSLSACTSVHFTFYSTVNPLNSELNPICYLLALLAHHFLHVSRIRVKSLTLRLLMSYIYIYIYIYIYDISSLRVKPIVQFVRRYTPTDDGHGSF